MNREQLTKDELATLLRQAEKAHAEYEKGLGKRDDDWPAWYAEFVLSRLEERGTASDS